MKKLLSALLVLVMLLSLPGVGALAASDELTWSLDKKGTLTISGKGEMPDYSGDTPPWEKYRDDINAVVIEKGVTHIGAQCFQFCVAPGDQHEVVSSLGQIPGNLSADAT